MMEPMTSLNPNDVLLGKGSGYTEYVGNQRFLLLVEERKHAYNNEKKNNGKARLAKEFLEHIHSLGGRFLKREEGDARAQQVAFVLENSVWHEVDEKRALEKIKQAFRQNRDYKRFNRKSQIEARGSGDGGNVQQEASNEGSTSEWPASLVAPAMAPDETVRTAAYATLQANLSPSVLPLTTLGKEGIPLLDYSSICSGLNVGSTLPIRIQSPAGIDAARAKTAKSSTEKQRPFVLGRSMTESIIRSQSPNGQGDSDATLDEVEASYALLALSLADHPKITDEQLQQEKSALTDEEKEGLLADLFGKQCSLESHRQKKVKRDFESNQTTSFLIQQMRAELDSIPIKMNQAVSEAINKCSDDEFSDSRLKHFLRADGMNPKLAAQRFVKYWESRRDLFGPEKYCLRMTLSEALADDVAAIKTGGWTILPHRDLTGRPMMLIEPRRITRNGINLSTESMERAAWYLAEIMIREYAEPEGNFIWIIWDKDSSVWHCKRLIFTRVAYYHRHCWPMREMPTHSCCSNAFMRRVVKPVLIATMGKAGRCRVMIHDVPESEILHSLAEYGIVKAMCPKCMGGNVDLDSWLSEFVEQRRAIEMEEL